MQLQLGANQATTRAWAAAAVQPGKRGVGARAHTLSHRSLPQPCAYLSVSCIPTNPAACLPQLLTCVFGRQRLLLQLKPQHAVAAT